MRRYNILYIIYTFQSRFLLSAEQRNEREKKERGLNRREIETVGTMTAATKRGTEIYINISRKMGRRVISFIVRSQVRHLSDAHVCVRRRV